MSQPRKILILSADIGEGHDAPARAIQREFQEEEPDARVTVVNGLTAMGGVLTSVVRDGSEVTFKWFPWLFELQYWLLMKIPPTRWLSRKLLTLLGARPLMRIIAAHDPDLIISTYPGVTAVLGEMRLKGKQLKPVIADITDLAGLHHWAHRGIDLHTVTHRESTETVERIAGRGSVRWAKPPTNPEFLDPPTREQARTRLGLPPDNPVIIISGGGWAVGDLSGGIEVALGIPEANVIALCGRNDAVREMLAERFGDEPRLRIEGFTDDMASFLAAGDVLVHATGGLTALEAMICGTNVVSYGFGAGHVRENNKAYVKLGLARVVKRKSDLKRTLGDSLAQPGLRDLRYSQLPSTAELSRDLGRHVEPTPTWKLVGGRIIGGTAVFALLAWAVLGSGFGFDFADGPLRLKEVSSVPVDAPVVGLIAEGPQSDPVGSARLLQARQLKASISIDHRIPRMQLTAINSTGSTPMPRLRRSGAFNWLATRSRLKRMIADFGLKRPFAYQPPGRGFSIGEYESAKSLGGKAVRGSIVVNGNTTVGALERGEIITLQLGDQRASAAAIDELTRALRRAGFSAVPVSELLRLAR